MPVTGKTHSRQLRRSRPRRTRLIVRYGPGRRERCRRGQGRHRAAPGEAAFAWRLDQDVRRMTAKCPARRSQGGRTRRCPSLERCRPPTKLAQPRPGKHMKPASRRPWPRAARVSSSRAAGRNGPRWRPCCAYHEPEVLDPASRALPPTTLIRGLSTIWSAFLRHRLGGGRKRVPSPATGNTAPRMRAGIKSPLWLDPRGATGRRPNLDA